MKLVYPFNVRKNHKHIQKGTDMARLTAPIILAALMLTAAISGAEEGPKTSPYPQDIVYSGTGMGVVFSHEMHVDMLGFACDKCHDSIFEPRAGAAKEMGDFKMSVMQDGDYCGRCHDGDTAFSTGDFASCANCHAGTENAKVDPSVKVVGPQDAITLGTDEMAAEFRHTSHVAFACYKCHTGVFPMKATGTITSMDEINDGKKCGLCHNGAVAFDATNCSACHPKM